MISISLDETHHVQNGNPLYTTRYKKVMSFHDGIAPVETENKAFFIDKHNNKLFGRIFKKAYGFYEGYAAVKDDTGYHHIDTGGKNLYHQRYAWVGNFQEGVSVVKDFEQHYYHIDQHGKRIYSENYCYTGDFKYGIAVVVNSDGKATHICKDGQLLHGEFYDELELFHKGYAVAKESDGYFHIDKHGNVLYNQRYKRLEPFYNGKALATTFDNKKIVLNEEDFSSLEVTSTSIDKQQILNGSFGFFKYQILFAILKLDVLNAFKSKKEVGLPEISKKLIERWLISENIINKEHRLTSKGLIIEDELKPLILYWQDLPFKTATNMLESLKKGDESFSDIFGKPYFNYLEDNEELKQLSSTINHFYAIDYSETAKYLGLNNEMVCDLGGGSGALLESVKTLYPNTTVILADKFKITNKYQYIHIDFFKPFSIYSDILLLSRVLHDWSDKKAKKILKHIADNMTSSTILYVFETIVPESYDNDQGITLSFHLLNFLGGHERTLKEFETLFSDVNLKVIETYKTNSLISVLKVMKK